MTDQLEGQAHSSYSSSARSQSPGSDYDASPAADESSRRRILYKYCCKLCKHTDKSKDKRACVCVVPLSQRRALIGGEGCQNCGCKGCSREDYISRGEDPEYRPTQRRGSHRRSRSKDNNTHNNQQSENANYQHQGGPTNILQAQNVYGQPQQYQPSQYQGFQQQPPQTQFHSSAYNQKSQQQQQQDNHGTGYGQFSQSQAAASNALNMYNIDKSLVGSMLTNDYRIAPYVLGFGVPQRTYSYIMGRAQPSANSQQH